MDRADPPITGRADDVKDESTPGFAHPVPPAPASSAGSTGAVVAAVALYVGVRLLLVAVLAGVMVLVGLPLLLSLLIAIVIALPLSLVAFRPLRARMNTEIEAATRVRRERRERLRSELRGDTAP